MMAHLDHGCVIYLEHFGRHVREEALLRVAHKERGAHLQAVRVERHLPRVEEHAGLLPKHVTHFDTVEEIRNLLPGGCGVGGMVGSEEGWRMGVR